MSNQRLAWVSKEGMEAIRNTPPVDRAKMAEDSEIMMREIEKAREKEGGRNYADDAIDGVRRPMNINHAYARLNTENQALLNDFAYMLLLRQRKEIVQRYESQERFSRMKHNPLIEYPDGLVMTHSDLQEEAGRERVIVFLEKPNKTCTDFDLAEYSFPEGVLIQNDGFSEEYLQSKAVNIERMGKLAFEWAKENK